MILGKTLYMFRQSQIIFLDLQNFGPGAVIKIEIFPIPLFWSTNGKIRNHRLSQSNSCWFPGVTLRQRWQWTVPHWVQQNPSLKTPFRSGTFPARHVWLLNPMISPVSHNLLLLKTIKPRWWLTYPSDKIWKSVGMIKFPIYGTNQLCNYPLVNIQKAIENGPYL